MRILWQTLKRNMAAGLMVIVPAAISIFLVWKMWDITNSWIRDVGAWAKESYKLDLTSVTTIPGLGLFVVLAVIFLIGFTARTIVGGTIIGLGERLVNRLPVVGTVYQAFKQLLETVLAENSKAFREAVCVEFPRKGLWMIAFVTGRVPGAMRRSVEDAVDDDEEKVYCFVPTAPNPTSGFLIAVPRSQTRPLEITVDDALKLVISGGIVPPKDVPAPTPAVTPPTDDRDDDEAR